MDIRQLADGQLPVATTTIYTSPTSMHGTVINTITCVNTHTATIYINLYLKPGGGAARRIIQKDLRLRAGEMGLSEEEVTLDPGDVIQADATVASKVDYIIGGIENE